MPELPYRVLLGPLSDPEWIGGYLGSDNLKVFGTEAQVPPADCLYSFPNCHFDDILAQLPIGWEPDVVVWLDVLRHHSLIPGIEAVPYPTALVIGDWNIQSYNTLQYAQAFDYVFSDSLFIKLLQQVGYTHGTFFPTISFAPMLDQLPLVADKHYDIAFIGTDDPYLRPERAPYVKRLTQLGSSWRMFMGQTDFSTYINILRHSKIVFNNSWSHNLNPRVYEAAICGALVFMEEGNTDIGFILPPDRCCVLYRDDNLEDLLDYYLTHDDERQQRAWAGYQRIQSFSYEKQFAWLLDLLPLAISVFRQKKPRRFNQWTERQKKAIWGQQWRSSLTPQADMAANALFQKPSKDPAGLLLEALHWIEMSYRLTQDQPDFAVYLQRAIQLLNQAKALWPVHTLIDHHLGWAYQLWGDFQTAQVHYQACLGALQNEPNPLHLPLAIDHFIISPFGQRYSGAQACFFYRWQRVSALRADQPDVLAQERLALLRWQTYKSIGDLWEHQRHQVESGLNQDLSEDRCLSEAMNAYQEAQIAYPSLVDASYMMGILALRQNQAEQALAHFSEALRQQPVFFNVFEILSVLAVHAFPPVELEQLLQQSLAILNVYLLQQDLRQRLLYRQYLTQIALALSRHEPWHKLLPLHFDQAFFEGLAPLLQHYQVSAPALTDVINAVWQSQVPEPLPPGLEAAGYHLEQQQHTRAALSVAGKTAHKNHWRVYDRFAQPGEAVLSPLQWPFHFAAPLETPFELDDPHAFQFLWLVDDWESQAVMPVLQAFHRCFSPHLDVGLWLWNPLLDPTEAEVTELTEHLEQMVELPITCLTDIPWHGPTQAAILKQAQVVGGSPAAEWNYYLWWSLCLGQVTWFQGQPFCPYGPDVERSIQAFCVASYTDGFTRFFEQNSTFIAQVHSLQTQLHRERTSIILDTLWQLRVAAYRDETVLHSNCTVVT